RVEKVSGEKVTLPEYLEEVWAAVSKQALGMIFHDAETAGLEQDALLTAMWLWTMVAPGSSSAEAVAVDDANDTEVEDRDADNGADTGNGAYTLEYDTARKISQGLGIHLEELTHVVQIKGNKATLLSVEDRMQYLFGKTEGVKAKKAAKKPELTLF